MKAPGQFSLRSGADHQRAAQRRIRGGSALGRRHQVRRRPFAVACQLVRYVLFEDGMEIRAAESEGAYAGAACAVPDLGPWGQLGIDIEG